MNAGVPGRDFGVLRLAAWYEIAPESDAEGAQ